MTTHYQIGIGTLNGALCGAENGRRKCMAGCDHCEPYAVDCPTCLHIAETLRASLNEHHARAREDERVQGTRQAAKMEYLPYLCHVCDAKAGSDGYCFSHSPNA